MHIFSELFTVKLVELDPNNLLKLQVFVHYLLCLSDTTSCWRSSPRASVTSLRLWRVWWWCLQSWSSWPTACLTTLCQTCGKERQERHKHTHQLWLDVITTACCWYLQRLTNTNSPSSVIIQRVSLSPSRPTPLWSLWPPGCPTCFRGSVFCRGGSVRASRLSSGSVASSSHRRFSLGPSRITPVAPAPPSTLLDLTLRSNWNDILLKFYNTDLED